MKELNAHYRPPASGQLPQSLVVLLHGLGADGQDLMDLAPLWAESLPSAGFVAPDAPFPCDMAPFGYQWFSLQDRRLDIILAGVQSAFPLLQGFLKNLSQTYNVPGKAIVLMGFSQGAMMALYTGLRRPEGCAGIMAYSGALVGDESLATETVNRPPVLMIHGDEDHIVPLQVFEPGVAALKSVGLSVEGHLLPGLGHGIDSRGIELGKRFLQGII